MRETTFENAKVGDRVYYIERGWGTIIEVYCGELKFKPDLDGISHTFKKDGKYAGSASIKGQQVLFWDEVKIDAPERPKRKVKKEIDIAVVSDGLYVTYMYPHGTLPSNVVAKGTLTYEVKE